MSDTGLCMVRVEADASAGLLITVTWRPDVHDPAGEVVTRTADVAVAVAAVAGYLQGWGGV